MVWWCTRDLTSQNETDLPAFLGSYDMNISYDTRLMGIKILEKQIFALKKFCSQKPISKT